MDHTVRDRNRRHLIKALALGLQFHTHCRGRYDVQSESDPAVWHHVHRENGRWYCGCRWASQQDGGYDPRSNVYPCKHLLLMIAQDLPIAAQDAIMRQDLALRAAAESGAQIRRQRPTVRRIDWPATVVAEAERIISAAAPGVPAGVGTLGVIAEHSYRYTPISSDLF